MIFYALFIPATILSFSWSLYYGSIELWIATLFFTTLYSGYGIVVGYHRLHSHKSFNTWEPIRKLLLYLGCQGAQGSPVTWSLIHNRSHHAHTDTERDVHTPTKGIWYAFIGWIFHKENHMFAHKEIFKVKKILDPYSIWCHRNYYFLVILNLFIIGIITMPWHDGRYLLASLNASFLSLIISGIVNVFGHTPIKGLTYQTTPMKNNSTNNPWLALFTWGESLHNNHHYRPRQLNFNTKWYELDVGRWLISTIKKS